MTKRRREVESTMEQKVEHPATPSDVILGIRCMGPGCRATTTLRFPGKGQYRGAVFRDPGWSVLNEPEEGHVVFACESCFEEEMDAQEDEGVPRIRGEG
jgi:hypothetical protein